LGSQWLLEKHLKFREDNQYEDWIINFKLFGATDDERFDERTKKEIPIDENVAPYDDLYADYTMDPTSSTYDLFKGFTENHNCQVG